MNNEEYKEITIACEPEKFEPLVALLSIEGYEGFNELDNEIQVYIPSKDYKESILKEVLDQLEINSLNLVYQDIAPQNWNADWEASFQPVTIKDTIYIRAPFHESNPHILYDLVIQPKMSFGTGHHDTTASVMELMLNLDFKNKTVFDYGCGTGILSVLASKMGAASIFANDIDDWAYENVAENLELNQIKNVDYKQGDISLVHGHIYDIILANINRNVLLDSMQSMANLLNSGGQLLMSGFYIEDIDVINKAAAQCNLKQLAKQSTDKNWTVMLYEKQ